MDVTTNSLASVSDLAGGYDLLHPEVRRWVREQGWSGLRDIQSRAILELRRGEGDVLVSASTAAGKTEAAFLPVLSEVADASRPGLAVLYIAPLKALINDQFGRLETLCERLDLPLVRWHGDAPAAAKSRMAAQPRGVVLITPESIEALFCRRPATATALLASLRFIVVDELHAFLTGPRGTHLASLLRRIDALTNKPARRVGLSATIGDLDAAAGWLRPGDAARVRIVRSSASAGELRLQLRGLVEPRKPSSQKDAPDLALSAVASHLMRTVRGTNALVFGGSRQRVEMLADLLRRACEDQGVPNEFFPHHGNLSKALREELEARLKASALPTTAVCTSTLELGIDIGSVTSVAQVGAPRSIASLRQRLGRSGRRPGVPATLRIYLIEDELGASPSPLDEVRQQTVCAVAAIRLLGQGFLEPPGAVEGLGSALLHQTLSVICEHGGARVEVLARILCGPGPFAEVPNALYRDLLRGMGAPSGAHEAALIEQASDGTLMLGAGGERLTASRDFYAMFESAEEWRIVDQGRPLGSLPFSNPILVGNLIVFAGRRWIVRDVDESAKVVTVAPHRGGRVPRFEGASGEPVHDRLAAEMLAVYLANDQPEWLDASALNMLAQGRAAFRRLGLEQVRVLRSGDDCHIFTWRGTRANGLLAIILGAAGMTCWPHDIGVVVSKPDIQLLAARLGTLQATGVPELETLAAEATAFASAKYDGLLPPKVLRRFWAMGMRDVAREMPSVAGSLTSAAGS